MLSQRYRFHGHGSLNYLFRNGKVVRNRTLLVRFVENKRRQNSRVTVIVGKKVAKSAVVRNRIRRRVYEIIRTEWGSLPEQVDVAVTAMSAELAVVPADELRRSVLDVLQKAGLYQPTN